jgi:hypothetical protein
MSERKLQCASSVHYITRLGLATNSRFRRRRSGCNPWMYNNRVLLGHESQSHHLSGLLP